MKSGNNAYEIIRAVSKHCKNDEHAPLHACGSYNLQIKYQKDYLKEALNYWLINWMLKKWIKEEWKVFVLVITKIRKQKKKKDRCIDICDLGEKQKRSKVVGSPSPFVNVGGSYREAIPYFTNIIIKQLIHCDKVILKVLHENNRTSMMNACVVKDTCSKITIDFGHSISGWSVFRFAVLCCNDKVCEY